MITIKEFFLLPVLVLVLAVAGECVQRAPTATAPEVLEAEQSQISLTLSAAQDTVTVGSQVRLPWKQRRFWSMGLKRLLYAILIKLTEPSRLRASLPENKPSRCISKTKAMRPAVFKDRQGPLSRSTGTV
jgi:hypothetical protein